MKTGCRITHMGEGGAFKIDYHIFCNYFNFTLWIMLLANDYLINFFG